MSCTSSSREGATNVDPPLLRGSAAAVARAWSDAAADRDDELRPRARGGVYRRGRGVRCRHVPGDGRDRGKFCHLAAGGAARVIDVPNTYATELDLDRRPVILKLHGEWTRPRADVGELRRHRGRLHRIPPSERGRNGSSGGPGRAPAAEPLPLPGYGVHEWNLRLVRIGSGPTRP